MDRGGRWPQRDCASVITQRLKRNIIPARRGNYGRLEKRGKIMMMMDGEGEVIKGSL